MELRVIYPRAFIHDQRHGVFSSVGIEEVGAVLFIDGKTNGGSFAG